MSENNRTPLGAREYYALRNLFGMVSSFEVTAKDLEKRVKSIPGGWRDMRLLTVLSEKLMKNVVETIPTKKLQLIRKELEHTVVHIDVKNNVLPKKESADNRFTYVPEGTIDRLVDIAVQTECLFCEKKGKDAKHCQLRKDIEMTYMYDIPSDHVACPFAGITTLEDAKKDA
jgi:hypothetical protein